MKKFLFFILCLIFLFYLSLFAEEKQDSILSIGVYPSYMFPLGTDTTDFFSSGFSADAVFRFKLPPFPLISLGARVGYDLIPVDLDTSLSVISGGLETGLVIDITSQLFVWAGFCGGYYYSLLNNGSGPKGGNLFIKPSVGLSVSLFPGFSMGIEGSYRNLMGLYHGAAVSLGFTFNLKRSGKSEDPIISEPVNLLQAEKADRLSMRDMVFSDIFPVYYSYYDDHSIGSGRIVNSTDIPIDDIHLNIFINGYMDNPKAANTPERLEAGQEGTLNLYALFTNNILEITEGTKVSAELILDYNMEGQEYREIYIKTLRIHNRNATTWDDDRAVVAFVTAKEPVVMSLSKSAAGIAREIGKGGLCHNLRTAIAIYEAYKLYGMAYVIDPSTPYTSLSAAEGAIDFLQFPRQTLQYRAGDCDDLSILTSALLESVGIETAFITVPGHIFIAFSSGLSVEEASRIFSSKEDLIIRDNKVWIPWEITELEGTYLDAWQTGAQEWRKAEAMGTGKFYSTHDAWQIYEPAGLPGTEIVLNFPEKEILEEHYKRELISIVEREIYPKVRQIEDEIAIRGETPRILNRLGLLYAKYGLMEKAEVEFKRLLAQTWDFFPALVNMGNICFMKHDMVQALDYYERAVEIRPSNIPVLLGMARTYHELENYEMVSLSYDRIKELDPKTAEKFAYLGIGKEKNNLRTSSASEMNEVMIWEE